MLVRDPILYQHRIDGICALAGNLEREGVAGVRCRSVEERSERVELNQHHLHTRLWAPRAGRGFALGQRPGQGDLVVGDPESTVVDFDGEGAYKAVLVGGGGDCRLPDTGYRASVPSAVSATSGQDHDEH